MNQFSSFLPIPEQYIRQLNQLNVPYSIDDFETLNCGQYLCPYCGATDRDRLYALYVKQKLDRVQEGVLRVLDIAPSKPLSWFLRSQPMVHYRCGDLASPLADEQVDICHMPQFPDASFDLIICSHVLEHVIDDRMAMRELLRVLSSSGKAILMVPILTTATQIDEDCSETRVDERWRRFGQDDHVRMYNQSAWLERLSAAGWYIQAYRQSDFTDRSFRLYGIEAGSVLYVGSRV